MPPGAAAAMFDSMPPPEPRFVDEAATPNERTYATFTHLTLLLGHATGVAIVLPALVMWLIKRKQSPFLDDHGKEAVNFQLSVLLYAIAIGIIGVPTCGAAWLLWAPLYVGSFIAVIVAAVAANKGEFFRYPACIRFIA